MARVTFADSVPASAESDERSPLLLPYTRPPALNDDEGRASVYAGKSLEGSLLASNILVGSKYSRGLPSSGDYLPLYQQRREDGVPLRKIVLCAVGTILLLGFVIASTLLLDTVEHSTEPSTLPPTNATLRNPAFLIEAKNAAAASENIVCSEMAIDVLKDGGNAVDAAVAATLCTGIVNPFSSGIGGGGFMTVRIPPSSPNASSEVWSIDFRETAPAAANTTMYVGNPEASLFGGLAIGVPGELRGLGEAHKRWGSLPWARVVRPSAELASGWKIGIELGRRLPMFEELIFEDKTWSAIFAPNGRILREGELAHRANYSRTLAAIAEKGADAFYEGEIAASIIDAVQSTGGIMTLEDLASYKVKVAPSLVGSYRGRKVYTTHAPTSGPALLHMLNLLERYDLSGEGRTGLNTHRIVEAMKFGFAARTNISDPSFVDDASRIDKISTKSFGELISTNVTDDTTHMPDYYNPTFDVVTDHGTSQTSIVDKNGMAVSITSTVNLLFGSQVMDPVTGIILNDEMNDFSTPDTPNASGLWPSPYNYPEPHKRPLSSCVPTIIEHPDGSFYLAVGGSGGSKIFPAVFQVILGINDWGLNPSEAVEWGRVHDQLYPSFVEVDSVLPLEAVNGLRERGHNVTIYDINRIAAVVQVVMKTGDKIYAASDSRKNGIAAGY
ncbi:hypothetical protein M0805_006638 [Coniferiporia weirii]|nr:hypothetical protein M0805_006638 [Coniferiporia weirii]